MSETNNIVNDDVEEMSDTNNIVNEGVEVTESIAETSDVHSVLLNPEIIRKKSKEVRDLDNLSREQLLDRINSLQKHVDQLRNIIAKNSNSKLPDVKKQQKARKFNFSKYKRRHVLLRVAYFGWSYLGFATQDDAGKTIESELFAALLRTRLVESREMANYHRCGRTDKGVSAFSQVVSLDVRTNLLEGEGVFAQEGFVGRESETSEELEFCTILNRNLPEDIQVTAWAACPSLDYSARFDCKQRTYRYFFPRADMDIVRMEEAGRLLIGPHDFRNLCKMDVNNGITDFHRRIDDLRVICDSKEGLEEGPYDMCQLIIVSNAFLWHQIRYIVTVLFLVGSGREEPEVVTRLLDVDSLPCRPQYNIASELPLNLFDCQYEGVSWNYDKTSVEFVLKSFQKLWTQSSVKSAMLRAALHQLESDSGVTVRSQADELAPRRKELTYTPLLELPVCSSLESKIKTVAKRKKIDLTSK